MRIGPWACTAWLSGGVFLRVDSVFHCSGTEGQGAGLTAVQIGAHSEGLKPAGAGIEFSAAWEAPALSPDCLIFSSKAKVLSGAAKALP